MKIYSYKIRENIAHFLISLICKILKVYFWNDYKWFRGSFLNTNCNFKIDSAVLYIALTDMVKNGWYKDIDSAYYMCRCRIDADHNYIKNRYGNDHALEYLKRDKNIVCFDYYNSCLYSKYLKEKEK